MFLLVSLILFTGAGGGGLLISVYGGGGVRRPTSTYLGDLCPRGGGVMPGPRPPGRTLQRSVRILLECILVE